MRPIEPETDVRKKDAYHHGDLRTQLVNAARTQIAQNGSDGFSISAACRAAGVSTAAPYRHFSDKGDLLIAVKIDAMRRKAALMAERCAPHPRGSPAAIAAIGKAYVEFATAEPNLFRFVFNFVAEHPRNEEVSKVGEATYGVLLTEVAAFLGRDGVDETVLRAAFPLWTFVHGAAFMVIDQMIDKASVPIDIDTMIDDATQRLLGPRPGV